MAKGKPGKAFFDKTGHARVYTTTLLALQAEDFPLAVDGNPISAYAIDPENPHMVYVTTLSPVTLEFLDVPWVELPEEM